MNPQKLAGQCAKLKCCINYEVDAYVEAQKRLPSREVPLDTKENTYYHFKTDIFKREITYSTDRSFASNLVTISADRAFEVIGMNKKGTKPVSLEADTKPQPPKRDAQDILGQESVTRFDPIKKKKKKRIGNGNENNPQKETPAGNGNEKPIIKQVNNRVANDGNEANSTNNEHVSPNPNKENGNNANRTGNRNNRNRDNNNGNRENNPNNRSGNNREGGNRDNNRDNNRDSNREGGNRDNNRNKKNNNRPNNDRPSNNDRPQQPVRPTKPDNKPETKPEA